MYMIIARLDFSARIVLFEIIMIKIKEKFVISKNL